MKNKSLKPFNAALVFSFCILAAPAFSQSSQEPQLTIHATGESAAMADEIHFRVNINLFGADAAEAFNRHKELETFLTELLINESIEHKKIRANPVNIYPRRHTDRQGFETQQQVLITLDDITLFEKMQLMLIENGFDNFSGDFSSSELKKATDQALEKAVEEAWRKAEILAKASGHRLGDVISIDYGDPAQPLLRRSGAEAFAMAAPDDMSLLQFERAIQVHANVRITFKLKKEHQK